MSKFSILQKLVIICILNIYSINLKSQTCKVWPLGVCSNISNYSLIKNAGFAYIEESAKTFLSPNVSDNEFNNKLADLQKNAQSIEICNNFLPSDLKIFKSNNDTIIKYAEIIFERAEKANIHTIIFANGSSRIIPLSYSPTLAKKQFIILLKKLGKIAQKHKIILCIEPINKQETNFITSIPEAISILKEVNNANIKLCVNYFHMRKENEALSNIELAASYIHHVHIAEMPMRTAPGFNGDDFTPLFEILRKINYKGKISIECGWRNMQQQINEAYTQLDKQMCEGYIP